MKTNKITAMTSKHNSKPLFVIYKTDLGSTSLGVLLEENLKTDFNFFYFDEVDLKTNQNKFIYTINYLKKIAELRHQVKKTSNQGHKIVFQNLKPALFSFGLWNSTNGIVISDFSHSLFEWCKKKTYKKDKRFYSQRILYQKLYKILTFTDNLKGNLQDVYGVSRDKLFSVPIPLDFENYYQVPQEVGTIPKVLFVGGEFYRKGGNHILNAWDSKLKGKCELTILTNSEIEEKEGIKVFNSVSKGTQEHISIFQSSDIFILPTDRDAYPIVLGEAAVSSLAIITTQYAFGAQNIILDGESGFISETAEDCIEHLITLLDNPGMIINFKRNTHDYIQKHFSREVFRDTILQAIQ
ncbi:MAG: hypothetical protein B7Y83_01160 [Flavobacteriales bacterium 32-34-25]|nr:MAG: hypothetical protein B7Y83_01160 [Flavobacteriales bacterium 32-34-25]